MQPRLHSVLDGLFRHERIGVHLDGSVYLHRWPLAEFRNGAMLALHHFTASDEQRCEHDHPKPFWSIGIAGAYVEHSDGRIQIHRAPWFRSWPAEHRHRITLLAGQTCWTLVFTGPTVRPWGFFCGEDYIPFDAAVDDDELNARLREACEPADE